MFRVGSVATDGWIISSGNLPFAKRALVGWMSGVEHRIIFFASHNLFIYCSLVGVRSSMQEQRISSYMVVAGRERARACAYRSGSGCRGSLFYFHLVRGIFLTQQSTNGFWVVWVCDS
jgi:hypothetical protein